MVSLHENPQPGADKSAVITKAVLRASANLGLTNRLLGKVLGLSEATVSRLRTQQKVIEPSEKAYELAVLFIRLYRSLDAITGDDAVSVQWLENHNTALHARPADMIQSVQGLVGVIQYLDSRRAIV